MSGLAPTAAAAALGLGLGVVTGMPLGVVNVAVIEAALAGRPRFATGIGLGGALADTVHAGLAFVGVGQLVVARPAWARGLAIAAALIIVGYAATAWRARRQRGVLDGRGSAPTGSAAAGQRGVIAPVASVRGAGYGVAAGALMTLPSPAALGAWAAVASAVWPTIATADALVLAAGVGLGSAAWFALLARAAARLAPESRIRAYGPRVALVLLVAMALAGMAHALAS